MRSGESGEIECRGGRGSRWTPRPWQELAYSRLLARQRHGVILDPGLGKTSTVLAAIDYRKRELGGDLGPLKVVLIAPGAVGHNTWGSEIKKWGFDLTYKCIAGATPKQRAVAYESTVDILCISPEQVPLVDWYKLALGRGWLIIDESTKFKRANTQRFRALRKALHYFPLRNILTGTFEPKNIEDVFAQVFILDDGEALGRYITHFRNAYMYPHTYIRNVWLPLPGSAEKIAEKVADLLTVIRDDVIDLPPVVENHVSFALPPGTWRVYKEAEQDFILAVGNKDPRIVENAGVLANTLRQISSGFHMDAPKVLKNGRKVYANADKGEYTALDTARLNMFLELMEELEGRQVLVYYNFQVELKALKEALPHAYFLTSDNATHGVEQFNSGKVQILVANPVTAGHGLNLQERCSDVIWYSLTWDYEVFTQANKRVHRQGQTAHRVVLHYLEAQGTIDAHVAEVLRGKEKSQDDFYEELAKHVDKAL
jgi:hypothetical protein